ncbi:hypothetical protein FNZ56_08990 [Pseudoluteimonas lycopersici]|uniref:Uncharacterized protein n=1 Tax=Pseudoluteimonas lycopersici TaxID=1324796 RepID=A0A516V663_9GAMM|nr:hypothetical protein [Lysobacter lycopersici]QDQ74003.1 hypothetical protein FNZ56_08990 [Lysobacter lycopersici]
MKFRIAIAFAISGIALAGCPRDQTPTHEDATPAEPATPASIAPPASTSMPPANEPKLPQSGRARAPTPEPDPLIPPPSPPPVDR